MGKWRKSLAETVIPVHEEPSVEGTHLRHHFATPQQQMDASMLGMWTFLITEVLFFGGMFAGYTVYRGLYPGAFASTSQYMDVVLGGTNTAVLICSSLTMALSVRAATSVTRSRKYRSGSRLASIWRVPLRSTRKTWSVPGRPCMHCSIGSSPRSPRAICREDGGPERRS